MLTTRNHQGLIVTGTDTNVGKTWVSAAILKAAASHFSASAYWKPVQTGDDDDTTTVENLSGGRTFRPTYHFKEPLSPHLAAALEGEAIDPNVLHHAKQQKEKETDFLLVEGAGGWLVPFSNKFTFGDVVSGWHYPVVIVVKDKLGALNHTALTIEAVRARGLSVKGIVLNQRTDEVGNFESLKLLHPEIPLLSLPHGDAATSAQVSWHQLFS